MVVAIVPSAAGSEAGIRLTACVPCRVEPVASGRGERRDRAGQFEQRKQPGVQHGDRAGLIGQGAEADASGPQLDDPATTGSSLLLRPAVAQLGHVVVQPGDQVGVGVRSLASRSRRPRPCPPVAERGQPARMLPSSPTGTQLVLVGCSAGGSSALRPVTQRPVSARRQRTARLRALLISGMPSRAGPSRGSSSAATSFAWMTSARRRVAVARCCQRGRPRPRDRGRTGAPGADGGLLAVVTRTTSAWRGWRRAAFGEAVRREKGRRRWNRNPTPGQDRGRAVVMRGGKNRQRPASAGAGDGRRRRGHLRPLVRNTPQPRPCRARLAP